MIVDKLVFSLNAHMEAAEQVTQVHCCTLNATKVRLLASVSYLKINE